jgi:hypothetical protein
LRAFPIGDRETHGVEVHVRRQRAAKSTVLRSPENNRAGTGADIVGHVVTRAAHDDGQHRARLGRKSEVPASNPGACLPQIIGWEADRGAAQRVGRNIGQACPRGSVIRHPRANNNAGSEERCHPG